MAKKNEVAAIGGFDLTLMAEANVTKDDIVAIATTAREEQLLSEQTELTVDLNKLRSEITKAENKVRNSTDKFVETKTKKKTKELAKAFEKLGFKVSIIICDQERVGGSIKYRFTLGELGSYHRENIKTAKKFSLPLSKEIIKAEKALASMKIEEMEKQEKIFEVKKGLSNMQGMERKAKAALAVAALQNSKAGKAILRQMQGVVALPQPPREK